MKMLVNFVALHGDGCRYALEMSKGLAENGVTIIAIVSKNMENISDWRACTNIELYEVDGYTSVRNFIQKLLKFVLFDCKRIRELIKVNQIKYVYVPIQSFWTFFAEVAIGRHKLIYTMHDPIPHKRFSLININNSYCARKAHTIVLLSREFNEYISRKYSPEHIVNLRLGSQQYYIDKSNGNNRLIQYRNDTVNFVFHGTINPHKGLHVLAEAYAKLSREYNNITLSIIGSGDFKPYEKEFSVLPNVTVINRWLADDEIADVFNGSNVVAVLPYLTATQSGVATLAMQCRALIVATNTGGLPEQITDGVSGYLAEAGSSDSLYEKMKLAIENKDGIGTMIETAWASIEGIDGYSQAKLLLLAIKKIKGATNDNN